MVPPGSRISIQLGISDTSLVMEIGKMMIVFISARHGLQDLKCGPKGQRILWKKVTSATVVQFGMCHIDCNKKKASRLTVQKTGANNRSRQNNLW